MVVASLEVTRHASMMLHPAGTGELRVDLADIATGLATTAHEITLDECDDTRRFARVLETSHYEAWVIRWSRAAALGLHDHGGSSGAVVVVDGELVEVRVGDEAQPGPRRRTLRRGDLISIAPRTVHSISNRGRADALSVHVYSPPLSGMNFFD